MESVQISLHVCLEADLHSPSASSSHVIVVRNQKFFAVKLVRERSQQFPSVVAPVHEARLFVKSLNSFISD